MDLTNEQIRQAVKGIELFLKERLPEDFGWELQTRKQILAQAVVAPSEEHDRLVLQYCRRDRKKQPISAVGGGYEIAPQHAAAWVRDSTALWGRKQRVYIKPISRARIPKKVENRPLVVVGVAWGFLAPILVD